MQWGDGSCACSDWAGCASGFVIRLHSAGACARVVELLEQSELQARYERALRSRSRRCQARRSTRCQRALWMIVNLCGNIFFNDVV